MKKWNLVLGFMACFLLLGCVTGRDSSVQKSMSSVKVSDQALKISLDQTILKFKVDFVQNNYEGIFGAMPPKFLEHIAGKAKIATNDLKAAMKEAMKQTAEIVKIESFEMDSSSATVKQSSKGRYYSLIPTKTVMNVKDHGRLAAMNQTLGIYDNDRWYLARITDEKAKKILQTIYPSFSEVHIPEPTKQMLN